MAVVLPSGGSLLGVKFVSLGILPFWSDDVIMTSPALLTDAVLTSLDSLAILVGVAFIGLGGVLLGFLTVSPNFIIILVLPDPTSYSESESLSS